MSTVHRLSPKQRLDVVLAARKLVRSRSQAESYVRLGQVKVNGRVAEKAGQMVSETDDIVLTAGEQYVGRAALKLKSAAEIFKLDFAGKTVLDVGSSTGGFTQYALMHGATKVIAVDVGTGQLHPSLRGDERIELHEKTDIRDVWLRHTEARDKGRESREGRQKIYIEEAPELIVGDVSFISLREILPHVSGLMTPDSLLVAMVKPQFEASQSGQKHKGVIKNDKMRRDILKDFETWAQSRFKIIQKADSGVPGSKGNVERFYLLGKLA
jgi:23S rRNA (cytidine1920-2'-O)/16S rRNA (cytidine1409-2'-O)-methyltransferase